MNPMVETGGIYLLMIRLHEWRCIQIGGLGYRFFHRGSYGYVGSARRGMKSRLNRHLKDLKRLHWHIDYLLRYAEVELIIYGQCQSDKECMLANELSCTFQFLPGFGSTDCRCTSHLFFSPHRRLLIRVGYSSFKRIGLTPRLYWKKPSMRVFELDLNNGWQDMEPQRSSQFLSNMLGKRIKKYGKLITYLEKSLDKYIF